jgi:hypothetical protein
MPPRFAKRRHFRYARTAIVDYDRNFEVLTGFFQRAQRFSLTTLAPLSGDVAGWLPVS